MASEFGRPEDGSLGTINTVGGVSAMRGVRCQCLS
jgi:hypothetical protein